MKTNELPSELKQKALDTVKDTLAYKAAATINLMRTFTDFKDIINHYIETKQIVIASMRGETEDYPGLCSFMFSDGSSLYADFREGEHVILPMSQDTTLSIMSRYFPFTDIDGVIPVKL